MASKTKINRTHPEASSIFAIAKAVSHDLYANKKIDINHRDIMTSLDLAMGSIDQDNPMNYNDQTISVYELRCLILPSSVPVAIPAAVAVELRLALISQWNQPPTQPPTHPPGQV